MGDRPLVVVLGPTGSGKSEVALRIAETFNGEIVNSDSVQVYRGFDVGSAKLPLRERRGIPHHLIDAFDPSDTCTAGEYARLAREAIAGISDRGRLPIVAGGTGFYVRALLEGLFPGPVRDDVLRGELAMREGRNPGFLWRALRKFDPAAAARIHINDRNKSMRALEVFLISRRPMTELFEVARDRLEGYAPLKVALDPPRAELYELLDRRSSRMLASGLLDEVTALLAAGVSPSAKPFEAIGYKQALALVEGRINVADAAESMRRSTRQYAKRQLTWWRRESNLHWVSGFGKDPTVVRSILNTVAEYLSSTD